MSFNVAESVALAVAQAIGISSDRQFLGLIGRVLPGWFPHLPDHLRWLRALVERISHVQQRLARWLAPSRTLSLTLIEEP